MSNAPSLRLRDIRLSERPVTMRLPFQFGSTEVRETAEIYCRVTVEVRDQVVPGISAQLMVPRWFDKRAGLSNEETIEELRRACEAAASVGRGMQGTVAALSSGIRAETPGRLSEGTPALAAGFGPALVEMALIDAVCRAADMPFWRAAEADLFGLSHDLPQGLSKDVFDAAMSGIGPPARIALRHTIGFDAPLVERGTGAPRDGLPVTVAEVAEETGIRAWKIKLKGDPDADARRLTDLQSVLAGRMQGGVTLDANEQYTADAFRALLEQLSSDSLSDLAGAVRFFEQPFARETALNAPVDFGVPMVIDESDDHRDVFPRALDLGWAGTSIKSCKGVLRALVNMARARAAGAILTAEDLTCQPGLCWTQDTAMAAVCGVRDVERNGHHFAGGMQGASEPECAAMLAAHDDIFELRGGRPALAIRAGGVRIGSLDRPGFGASDVLLRSGD
ncbi:enolase C-terminal domain-like protein [Psychromarinibacter sp. C21-152]|uniref:Enolase C-terminal domain-like protein n=1 Tax=Psychromarinibacter sediminicola TaxID=3033385 RepID=A0AAE3NYV6_9RHOB|nr:enolase C-terminal domain-like protein [Psychromarinibacter sediminicola]MDF0603227.1 enolase C-terminal domain-like protein [Psychromarinibacter sediminicola]